MKRARHKNKKWTNEEIKYVHDNIETMSVAKIARTLGRTDYAIRACISINKFRTKKEQEEKIEQQNTAILELYNQNKTYKEMANILNIPFQTVLSRMTTLRRKHLIKNLRRKSTVKQYSTLCWKCKHSIDNGCSWSKCFKPVDGWKAVENTLGYCVINCPLFERG